jgi:hypothetical protein
MQRIPIWTSPSCLHFCLLKYATHQKKDIAMKKLALLSAVMTLGISSWAFAADNPPPPPEKGAQHQGKPPAKNGQHDGKQAQHNGKQPQQMANSRSRRQTAAAQAAASRQRRRAQRETAAAKSVTPQAWPSAPGFFHLLSATLTNSCPSLRCPKKPAQRLA